ncbi:MAG: hypothetical protein P8P83_02470 [Rickettsiaceae bacterium]|nr:hypothetical protein [Rickettsiaceae bacterium]
MKKYRKERNYLPFSTAMQQRHSSKDKTDFTFTCNDFSDLLLGGKCPYIHTSALVYRKTKQDIDYAQWSKSTYRGDLIRTLFYGSQGKVKYLNEVMSVYRINGDGIYTSLNNLEKEIRHVEFFLYHKTHTFEDKYNILFDKVTVRQYNELNNFFNGNLPTKAKYFFLKCHLAFNIRLASSKNFIKRSIYFIGSVTGLALFHIMNTFMPYNKW